MKSLCALMFGLFCTTAVLGQAASSPASKPAGGDDYWVEPMKKVHEKFTGQKGVVAQFGDSITITMAFFNPLHDANIKNMPKELAPAHEWLRGYVQGRCWSTWKSGEYGNDGGTTIDWGLSNMDKWLKKMNPELAVVMWGTNDTYRGPHPPKYTQNLSEIIQKMLDNGTVPILYTIPPVGDQTNNPAKTTLVEGFVQAARDVAKEKKVPLVDFYAEMLARQPVNFAKTLMGDNLHPSYPQQYANDFSDEALANSGYTLRNYLTLKKMWEVNKKVLEVSKPVRTVAAERAWKGATYKDLPAILIAKPANEPKIDGSLDEPAWQTATAYEMRRLDGDVTKLPNATFVKLLATDKALYVAFQCKDKDAAHLKSRQRPRDENVWEDDSVEVFIRAGAEPGKDYFQLAINPAGSFMDARGRENAAWQGNPKIGAKTDKDEWTVEVMIPLVELQMKQEQAKGGPWRLNLTRMRQPRDGEEAEEAALSPTQSNDNHAPAMFAYAWLEALGGKLPAEAEKAKP